MKRWLAVMAITAAWSAWGVPMASAQLGSYQPPQVTPGPSFSPYLNMIRNNPAAAYFGIVQPQMNTYGTLQQMQQDIRYGQNTGTNLGMNNQPLNNNALMTGHPVMFGSTAQYFPIGSQIAGMGMGGMGGMGGGMGMGGMGMAGGGMGMAGGGMGMGGGFGVGIGVGPTINNSQLPQGYILPR